MADYLLLETGDKLILEDGSGNLLLEDAAAAVTAAEEVPAVMDWGGMIGQRWR
jgi:hypothetical protein